MTVRRRRSERSASSPALLPREKGARSRAGRHWHSASEQCWMRSPAVWLARGLNEEAACWLWLMEAVYPVHTGDTPVAPGAGGEEASLQGPQATFP